MPVDVVMPDESVVTVSDEDIALVRSMTNTTPAEYSDEVIAAYIAGTMADDGSFDLDQAASDVWAAKASKYAGLVDITESGSTRKLSSLYKQAMEMAKYYADKSDGVDAGGNGSTTMRPARTRAITRA